MSEPLDPDEWRRRMADALSHGEQMDAAMLEGFGNLNSAFSAVQQQLLGMDRYEYKIIPVGDCGPELEDQLCRLGADRWKIVSNGWQASVLMFRKVLADDAQLAALLGG